MLSRQALANFVKGLAKLTVIGAVMAALLWPQRRLPAASCENACAVQSQEAVRIDPIRPFAAPAELARTAKRNASVFRGEWMAVNQG
jgi:hypothetical protein